MIELSNEAVSKKVLENGLVLFAKESLPKDLVGISVKVRAGSSLEEEYLGSGISHLVEHMLFKGTRTRRPGSIEKEIKSYGGFINGSVSQDLTEYTIILPAEHAGHALSLLKDMLLNAAFDAAEFDKEKEVILRELRLNNDEPQSLLMRLLNETAYLYHTYKYPLIGYENKFRALRRDDAVKYYNRMYAPNRMAIAIAGGVKPDDILAKAESEFKDFRPPNYKVIGLSPQEPAQIGRRDARKTIATNLAYLAVAFHSTGILDEDLFAMDVLSIIIGRGDNSRLNTSLVKQQGLAHSVTCWNFTPRDPGLFVITALLDPGKLTALAEAIAGQVARVRSGAISSDELEGARRMVIGDYIFNLETLDFQAGNITSDYLFTGNCGFSERYLKGVQAVSLEDLKRVANKYLRDDGITTAAIVPETFKEYPEGGLVPSTAELPAKKIVLPNGLNIVIRQSKKTPTVSITVLMAGGLAVEKLPDNGISNFTANMLLKGTSNRKEDEITGAVEKLGGNITPFSGFDGFGVTINVLSGDLDTAISLLYDILASSVFPEDEIEKARALILAAIRAEDEDIFQRGFYLFRKELFGNSPYALRHAGEREAVSSLTRRSIVNFYKTYTLPGSMIISISGDVDPDALAGKMTKIFSALRSGEILKKEMDCAAPGRVNVRTIRMEKEQSLVVMGVMTAGALDPDRYALEVLSSVLSGHSGRLFDSIRNKAPLAYTLGCFYKSMSHAGFFALYAACAKEKVSRVEQGLMRQIEDIRKRGLADEELLPAKRELICSHGVKMQTNEYFSQTAAIDELYGLGCDDIFRYKAGIEGVTGEDVKRVAVKYLDPDRYSEVVIAGEQAL